MMLTSVLNSTSLEMPELELKSVSEAARSGEDDVPVAVGSEFSHDAR